MTAVDVRPAVLGSTELVQVDALWRAANYLSAGQIYLMANPLLRAELRPEHVKPRLLGHWGTSPGLNFVYAHLNRAILTHDLNAMLVTGPVTVGRRCWRTRGWKAATPKPGRR